MSAVGPYRSRLHGDWPAASSTRVMIGTLVRHDIVGFTRLSERLAAQGRGGAEEITIAINGVFSRMIAAVLEHGGDVVSFGGDALLVLFEGDQHEERACRSAAAIQATVRRHAPIRLSSGAVRLRVCSGVETGEFIVVRVGAADRWELLFVAPDATSVVRLEMRAAPGQVAVGAKTAAAVPARWTHSTFEG